jgi:LmbE family N-acetylglucosaminyl deacetylase
MFFEARRRDTGMNNLLNEKEIQQAFIKIFSKYKFDLAITHPPHGGEKPHPHHIQIYSLTKKFCQYHNCQFGFFAEQKLLFLDSNNKYVFNFKKRKYIFFRIFQSYMLIRNNSGSLLYLLTLFFDIWTQMGSFFGYETAVDLAYKQNALLEYMSQSDVLKSYNAYYKKKEYLFLKINTQSSS